MAVWYPAPPSVIRCRDDAVTTRGVGSGGGGYVPPMDATDFTTTIVTGAAAGSVGTLAMDTLWFRRARTSGSDAGFAAWEFSGDAASFDDAGAPAQVGRKLAAALGIDLPDRAAGTTNDIVHWSTGLVWGIAGSLAAAGTGVNPFVAGLAAGAAAFGAAYTVLPLLGVYEPIWTYDVSTIWKDASAHATFGIATGVSLAAVATVRQAVRHRRALGLTTIAAQAARSRRS